MIKNLEMVKDLYSKHKDVLTRGMESEIIEDRINGLSLKAVYEKRKSERIEGFIILTNVNKVKQIETGAIRKMMIADGRLSTEERVKLDDLRRRLRENKKERYDLHTKINQLNAERKRIEKEIESIF